jgi:RNA polymerase sigma-70 factor (ECF subfamily)
VVVYGDGGGAKPSWPRPIRGQARVIRLMSGLADQVRRLGLIVEPAEVNGEAGAVVRDPSGGVVSVFALELAGDRICAVRSVINPAKLGHLGPLADRDALRAV